MLDAWDTDTYLEQNIHGNHALLSTFLRKYDLQILASLQEEERNYDGDNEEHYMQIHTTQYHSIFNNNKKKIQTTWEELRIELLQRILNPFHYL